jgi:Putative transposase
VVLVLSKLFRRLMLEKIASAHAAGKLFFFGAHAHLADDKAFTAFLAPLKRTRWFVYSKRPFAGPQAVLAYLSRYTHCVAISNGRLIAADANGITFKVKDYRIQGPGRYTTMTLEVAELSGASYYMSHPRASTASATTVAAGTARAEMVAKARDMLAARANPDTADVVEDVVNAHTHPCPCCGGRMIIVELFEPGCQPQHHPINPTIRIDTS